MRNFRFVSVGRRRAARPRRGGAGFSLVETLVSLVIMIVVVVAALAMFDRSNRMTKVETSVSDAQQNARYASYQLVREARMAGAGGVPASMGNVQIGVTLSIGSSSYHSATAAKHLVNNVNSSTDTVFLGGTHHVRKGTDVLHIRGIISAPVYDLGTSSFNIGTGTLVIHSCTKFPDPTAAVTDPCYPNGQNDVSSFNSFSTDQPRLFVMADGLGNVGIALMTDAVVGTDPNGQPNATLTLNTANAYANSLNPTGAFSAYLTTPTRGGVLDDLIYFVDDGTASGGTCGTTNQSALPGPCHPQLSVAQWGSGTVGGGCTVTAEDPFACATVTPIADDIEDLQIAYGEDFRKMTCTGSGSSLSCTGSGTLAAPVSDASLSVTDGAAFTTIVKGAYGSTAPNADPSEDASAADKDEWIGNVSGEIAAGTFDYSNDLSLLKAVQVSILSKGTNPDPKYVGLGANTWSLMDGSAESVSQQNTFAYHRRLVSMRVDFRNYNNQ